MLPSSVPPVIYSGNSGFVGGFLTNALRSYSTTAQRLLREEPVNRAGSLVRSADQKAQDLEQPKQ